MPGCGFFGSETAIGFSLAEDGSVIIHFQPCTSDTKVLAVSLHDSADTRDSLTDDTEIWRITSQQGTLRKEFIVGGNNSGFRTVTELRDFPTESRLYAGSVETSRVPTYGDYFELNSLSEDMIRVGDRYVARDEFYSRNTRG